jgi:hypothetical protein
MNLRLPSYIGMLLYQARAHFGGYTPTKDKYYLLNIFFSSKLGPDKLYYLVKGLVIIFFYCGVSKLTWVILI